MTSLDRVVANWALGRVTSDQLPAAAVQALDNGLESPSMIALAVSKDVADPRHHRLFESALRELGRPLLTRAEAGRLVAQEWAERVCAGSVAPVEGAKEIWMISLECDDLGNELGIFGGRVSEYEGLSTAADRDRVAEMIVGEAQRLLSRGVETSGS
jgi:hypothetical protein